MTGFENLFHIIINEISNGVKGKMFGVECIKSTNGKTAAFSGKKIWFLNLTKKIKKEL